LGTKFNSETNRSFTAISKEMLTYRSCGIESVVVVLNKLLSNVNEICHSYFDLNINYDKDLATGINQVKI
jgi:hypothetical protein